MSEQVKLGLDPIARIDAIDILRGIALFGVMAVNIVTEFRVSLFAQFLGEGVSSGWLEQCVGWLVRVIFEWKAICVFSFLFGVGVAIQYDSLTRRGRAQYWMLRRLLVLLLFGLVHLLLIWNGDILTEYAIAALLVLPMLRARIGFLSVLCALCLLLFAAMPMLPLPWDWPSRQAFAEHVRQVNALLPVATWLEVRRFSIGELPWMVMLHAYAIARTVGLMLLGVVLWCERRYETASIWRRRLIVAILPRFGGPSFSWNQYCELVGPGASYGGHYGSANKVGWDRPLAAYAPQPPIASITFCKSFFDCPTFWHRVFPELHCHPFTQPKSRIKTCHFQFLAARNSDAIIITQQ